MKIDQWTEFVQSVEGDSEAQEILRTGDAAKIAALAQSKGFGFTEQDVADARIQSGELSDAVIERVSGGHSIMR